MAESGDSEGRERWRKQRSRLRRIGVVVLLSGLVTAGIVYGVGKRSPNLSDDPLLAGYSRPQERNMELLYGRMGRTIDQLLDDLSRPGTQAVLIAGASAILAGVLFYFAGPAEDGERAD